MRHKVPLLLILLFLLTGSLKAQEPPPPALRLLKVDADAFPQVKVTFLTLNEVGAPVNDLSDLTVREDSLSITDFTLNQRVTGVDVTFVVDANESFIAIDDDSGETRGDKVRASITRFANAYMDPAGLDRVSIIVPEPGTGAGRYLVEDATDPATVVTAIQGYQAGFPQAAPVNSMLATALEKAAQRQADGRYQAVLLFSDSRRLDEQLSLPLLTTLAQDEQVPVYTAILGARADERERASAASLSQPTRGLVVHMPQPESTDAIYEIWSQQSVPPQLVYQSRARDSGPHQVALSLGTVQAGGTFSVAIEPPTAVLQLPRQTIRRVGMAPETPLADLQPAVQPVQVTVTWPERADRDVATIALTANDRVQSVLGTTAGEDGVYTLSWDISGLDEGELVLSAEVVDSLGYRAMTEPVTVSVEIARPAPLASTVTPAGQTMVLPALPVPASPALAGLGGVLLMLVFAGVVLRRRRKAAAERAAAERRAAAASPSPESAEPVADAGYLADLVKPAPPLVLVRAESIVGRDDAADIHLDDSSVSPLHARIGRRGGTFWLYDEGSSEGTFHNYERLGLAPRELAHGDVVEFGRLRFRFLLQLPPSKAGSADGGEVGEQSQSGDETTKGYDE